MRDGFEIFIFRATIAVVAVIILLYFVLGSYGPGG